MNHCGLGLQAERASVEIKTPCSLPLGLNCLSPTIGERVPPTYDSSLTRARVILNSPEAEDHRKQDIGRFS